MRLGRGAVRCAGKTKLERFEQGKVKAALTVPYHYRRTIVIRRVKKDQGEGGQTRATRLCGCKNYCQGKQKSNGIMINKEHNTGSFGGGPP